MKKCITESLLMALGVLVCMAGIIEPSRVNAGERRVAVFPFEVISREDQSFIGKGMGKMLCTRVGQGNVVAVTCLDKPVEAFLLPMDRNLMDAVAVTAELHGVEFLLTGSITIVGTGVSTDARLVDVSGETEAVNIHETGSDLGDVMRQAAVIAEKVRHVLNGGALPATGSPEGASVKSSLFSPPVPDLNTASSSSVKGALSSDLQESKANHGADFLPVFFSSSIRQEIAGIAVADVDGNGTREIVVMDTRRLTVFSLENQKMLKLGEFKGKHYQRFMGLDAMDVDGDSRDELLVTVLDRRNQLRSIVMGFAANGRPAILARDIPWFFRVVAIDGKALLLGQKNGTDDLFWGEIYQLSFDGGRIQPQHVVMDGTGGIPGRALGRLQPNGPLQMVWFDADGFLNVGRETYEKEWVSDRSWGSTALFVDYDQGKEEIKKRIYLDSRVAVADVDGDDDMEVVSVVNDDLARTTLAGFRKFIRGRLSVLGWRQNTMVAEWETHPVTGYVADFSLADMNGDGRLELVYATVSSREGFMGSPKSHIVVQTVGEDVK